VCPARAQQGPAWSAAASLQEGAGGLKGVPLLAGRDQGAGRGTETPSQTPRLLGSDWQHQPGFPMLVVSAFGWGWISL